MLTDVGGVEVQKRGSEIETERKVGRDHKAEGETVGSVLPRTLDSVAVICVL